MISYNENIIVIAISSYSISNTRFYENLIRDRYRHRLIERADVATHRKEVFAGS